MLVYSKLLEPPMVISPMQMEVLLEHSESRDARRDGDMNLSRRDGDTNLLQETRDGDMHLLRRHVTLSHVTRGKMEI